MKGLAFAAYFFALGYLTRKTGLDRKIAARIDAGIDGIAARAGEEFAAAFNETITPIPLRMSPGGTGLVTAGFDENVTSFNQTIMSPLSGENATYDTGDGK